MYATFKVSQITSRLDDDGEELEGFPLCVVVGLKIGERLLAGPRAVFSGLRVAGVEYPGEVRCDGGEPVVVRARGSGFEIAIVEEDEE